VWGGSLNCPTSHPIAINLAQGEKAIIEIIATTFAGMTTAEFERSVKGWSAIAKHPTAERTYTEMAYRPMRELLAYLRANEFKTFIVSGGGSEFTRAFAEEVYGIPPEQVVGSVGKPQFALRDRIPVIVKLPEVDFIENKDRKPIGIHRAIGRHHNAAFGD
jgi:hypothetical protein